MLSHALQKVMLDYIHVDEPMKLAVFKMSDEIAHLLAEDAEAAPPIRSHAAIDS